MYEALYRNKNKSIGTLSLICPMFKEYSSESVKPLEVRLRSSLELSIY